MSATHGRPQTLVVRFSRWRITLLSLGLVVCAALFLSLAGFFVWLGLHDLPVLAKAALFLMPLGLVPLSAYLLLLLIPLAVRIEVGPDGVKLKVPRVRGPLPLLGMLHANLSYDDIVSVQRREEVYVGFGVVTVQMAYSLVMRNGGRILLGVMPQNVGAALPFDRAAEQIAARLGPGIVDRGAVRVGGIIRALVRDVPAWNAAAMPLEEQRHWRWRGALTAQLLTAFLGMIVLLRACTK
jgi:hypothetical protein